MRSYQRRRVIEIVLAFLLSVGLDQLAKGIMISTGYHIGLALIPLIWIALRYGGALAIILSALVGVITYWIPIPETFQVAELTLYYVLPMLSVGLAGFFARNVHRTINNLRYASTRLNIITSAFIVTLAYYLVKFGIVPFVMPMNDIPLITDSSTWIGVSLTFILIVIVLLALMKNHLLPSRSPYLSRRETSTLLND